MKHQFSPIDNIEQYINGTLNADDLQIFEQTLTTDTELQKEVKIYRTIFAAIKSKAAEQFKMQFKALDPLLDTTLDLDRYEEEAPETVKKLDNTPTLKVVKEIPSKQKVIKTKPFYQQPWLKVAAVLVICLVAYLLAGNQFNSHNIAKSNQHFNSNLPVQNKVDDTQAKPAQADGEDAVIKTNGKQIIHQPITTPNLNNETSTTNSQRSQTISLKKDKNFLALNDAQQLYHQKAYAAAISKFQNLSNQKSSKLEHYETLFYLGLSYLGNDNTNEAIEQFKDFKPQHPFYKDAQFYLAMAHLQQNNIATAKQILKEIKTDKTDNPYIQKATTVLNQLAYQKWFLLN